MRGILSPALLTFIILSLFLQADFVHALDLNISITIPGSSTPVEGGGGRDQYESPKASALMSGFAYPYAILTFLRNGIVIGTEIAGSNGLFRRSFSVDPGVASYAVWARDRNGLISPTVSVTLDVEEDSEVRIEALSLPPTIAHEHISEDGSLTLYGSAFPRSTVRVFNNISSFALPLTIIADFDGDWEYTLDRAAFNPRNFAYKANYQIETEGVISPFSSVLELKLLTCLNSDYNQDGAVNITDLSILLFYWGRSLSGSVVANACVDRNQDQEVDLRDFSVLMYEWTAKYELQ